MRKPILPGVLILAALLALAAWAPWLNEDLAARRAGDAFLGMWQGVADGCGFNCQGCGVKTPEKAWFGYWVPVEYACGLLPADTPEFHQTKRVFVSFVGTVHGINRP